MQTKTIDSGSVRARFLGGLFLICMCGLMLQIVETRILSVISYYYLAFFAISMAMFGMTAGSLFVYFRPTWFPASRLFENMVWICVAFALAVVLTTLLLISTVLIVGGNENFLMMVLSWLKLILILATPYFFAGMAISLALTRSPWPVPLVYSVDLLGAAAGCLVVLAVLTVMDSVSALFLIGAIAALAAGLFALAQRAATSSLEPRIAGRGILARPLILAAGFALLAFGNAAIQPYGLKLSVVKDTIEYAVPDSFMRWNSFSRINVEPNHRVAPLLWGPSPAMMPFTVDQRYMAIDGAAGTAMYGFDGDLTKLDFLKYDVTNLAYAIRHDGRAAVIGVGGGRDLLSAHLFGFHDVTGVELNPIFVDMLSRVLRSYNHLADLAGTRLVVDDARSWFARSTEHFDTIQMSMIDTWAATGAGAFSLSENGLYTLQGWRAFFDRLTPTGAFTVSRWYAPDNVAETGRMLSLAVRTLMSEGVSDPRAHVFLAATDHLATLIVTKAPMTPDEISVLTATTNRLRFTILASPATTSAYPILASIMAATTPQELDAAVAGTALDLSPPTDDRPFFFNQLRMTDRRSLWLARTSSNGVMRGNLMATVTLGVIIALSAILVLITIVVPSLPSVRQVSRRLALLGTAYFLLIGAAFMFVEIGLIQRISIFLGHPIYGLAIGLFGIIVSTGLGSLCAARLSLLKGARIQFWAGLLGLYLILLPTWFPLLVGEFASAGLIVRAAVSLSAIIPSGILMGFGFPTGMEMVNAIDRRPTPWFWAVNGAAGVLAAGIATVVSIVFTISTTLWCGAACYLLLCPIALALLRSGRATGFTAERTIYAEEPAE